VPKLFVEISLEVLIIFLVLVLCIFSYYFSWIKSVSCCLASVSRIPVSNSESLETLVVQIISCLKV